MPEAYGDSKATARLQARPIFFNAANSANAGCLYMWKFQCLLWCGIQMPRGKPLLNSLQEWPCVRSCAILDTPPIGFSALPLQVFFGLSKGAKARPRTCAPQRCSLQEAAVVVVVGLCKLFCLDFDSTFPRLLHFWCRACVSFF